MTPPERRRSWARTIAVATVVLAAVLTYLWFSGSEQRAIRGLPEEQRHALFARTLENLRSVCGPADNSLRDFCQQQANLALRFEECDRACQELAFRLLSRVQIPR